MDDPSHVLPRGSARFNSSTRTSNSLTMSDSQYIDRKTAARSYRPSGHVRSGLKLFMPLIVHCGYTADVRRTDASTGTVQSEECAHRACDWLVYRRSVVILDERCQARQF